MTDNERRVCDLVIGVNEMVRGIDNLKRRRIGGVDEK